MNIKTVGIVGAGIMGSGIAQVCALNGFSVVLLDVSLDNVQKGLASIGQSCDRLIAKGKLGEAERDAACARISASTSYVDLADVDLVIEAATENEAVKLDILATIGKVVRPDAIVASNTSSISITKLATAVARPERFLGMHFFNPVPLMTLVELIRGLQTAQPTLDIVRGFVEALQKVAIVARNSPCFLVNRILCPMINEAVFALQDGLASAEEIDTGVRLGCNHPIGPLALADLIGIDTLLAVMEVFHEGFGDPKYRPAPLLREMVDAGYLGRKTGRGFFTYA